MTTPNKRHWSTLAQFESVFSPRNRNGNTNNHVDNLLAKKRLYFFEDFRGQILGKLYPTGSKLDPKSAVLYRKFEVLGPLKNFKFTIFLEGEFKINFES
jgi:hypothetical protein